MNNRDMNKYIAHYNIWEKGPGSFPKHHEGTVNEANNYIKSLDDNTVVELILFRKNNLNKGPAFDWAGSPKKVLKKLNEEWLQTFKQLQKHDLKL